MQTYFECNHCRRRYSPLQDFSVLIRHLIEEHRITHAAFIPAEAIPAAEALERFLRQHMTMKRHVAAVDPVSDWSKITTGFAMLSLQAEGRLT